MAKAKPNPNAREIKALQARILQLENGKPTRQQLRDAAWLTKRDSDAAIESYVSAMPKGDYCRLSDRQHKLIDDAARNYGLPIDGATINLGEALRAVHDLLAANGDRLRGSIDGDRDELEDEKLRQQIGKLQSENARLLIAIEKERGETIPVAKLRQSLISVSASMRVYGKAFARISNEARDLWNEVCDALDAEIASGALQF